VTTEPKVRRVQMKAGREDLILETGRLAKQADAAVMVQYGGTVVLVSVVVSKKPREGTDYLPLFVEYQEKTYAAGKIPGGFFKREGRPTEAEILTSRIVDRPIRPLLPKSMRNEVQIMALMLSFDGVNDPDVLAVIGASAAINLSPAPVKHPVGAVRVGRIEGKWVVNPTYEETAQSDLDLLVCTTPEGVIMVESGAKELPEAELIEAMRFAEKEAAATIELQKKLIAEVQPAKGTYDLTELDKDFVEQVRKKAGSRIAEGLEARVAKEFGGADDSWIGEVAEQLNAEAGEGKEVTSGMVQQAIEKLERAHLRGTILEKKKRIDGRGLTDIRPITCEVGVLPRTHGSGLFSRGQTQSLAAATLGTASDEQMIDSPEGKWNKSFMLHYNFPPFSVGEVRPVRGPGRREIGHGALAEKALKAVMPGKETFPYTVRLVSEILESNGSSSMATVCGGTLALMDAGVPIGSPVAGIAMGLIRESDAQTAVLTDIMGLEDHFGDMDFKVAGTAKGVTALQLDLKLTGVPLKVLETALMQARPAREHILKKIAAVIGQPRQDLSPYAPRITVVKIDPEKIGGLIGPGGKMIRRIIAESGAQVDVEDDGTVMVSSANEASSQKAVAMIKGLTEEPELGRVYDSTVKRIMSFGVFCEIAPGKEGLCHVSELADGFVENVESIVKVGDKLKVKVIEVDAMGRVNLSHKQAAQPDAPPVPHRKAGEGNGARRGGPGGGRDRGREGRPGGGSRFREGSGGRDRGGRGGRF